MLLAFWTWLSNNKIAQAIGAILLAFVGYKTWENNVQKGVRRQEREAAARIAAEREAQIISTITENSNEYVRASERVRSHTVAEQLPDERAARLPEEHYRDRPDDLR